MRLEYSEVIHRNNYALMMKLNQAITESRGAEADQGVSHRFGVWDPNEYPVNKNKELAVKSVTRLDLRLGVTIAPGHNFH